MASGVLDYFPDALAAVARVSWQGNEQHNPGQALHWARSKSTDEADTMIRHFLQRGTTDTDGIRHSAKMVWRALALLQKEIEAEREDARKAAPYAFAHAQKAKDDALIQEIRDDHNQPHYVSTRKMGPSMTFQPKNSPTDSK